MDYDSFEPWNNRFLFLVDADPQKEKSKLGPEAGVCKWLNHDRHRIAGEGKLFAAEMRSLSGQTIKRDYKSF